MTILIPHLLLPISDGPGVVNIKWKIASLTAFLWQQFQYFVGNVMIGMPAITFIH